jgi:hypothetical protein
MVRAYRDAILGRNLAEAGIQQAIREILTEANVQALDEDGQVAFYSVPPGSTALARVPSLQRTDVPLGAGAFSSANGAETEDYMKLPVPYQARNGNFQDTDELLQVKGVTPDIYYGHDDKPGLVDFVSARSRGTVNVNTAPPPVLSAVGLSDAEINDVVQARTSSPYATVPGRFGGRRVTVGSNTFRIESEGIVNGDPKARIVAIVQKTAAGTGTPPSIAVLSWRQVPVRGPARQEAGAS